MKLILTQEVDGLGQPGDVVTVKDGYGRNYLVPRKLALTWSAGAEKQINGIKRARQVREIRNLDHAKEIKTQIEALTVTLSARAGDSGKLFGSVTVGEVATAVRSSGGPLVEKRSIRLGTPIRSVGSHEAQVDLHPGVVAVVKIKVVAA